MCSIERVGNLEAEIKHRAGLQRSATDPMPEGLPLQQFHGDEGSPLELIYFVNCADVRMVQGGRCLCLPLKTTEGLRVIGEFVRQEFQRDMATQLHVFGLIHYPHAPATNLADDVVVGHRLPYRLERRGHWLDMLGVGDG